MQLRSNVSVIRPGAISGRLAFVVLTTALLVGGPASADDSGSGPPGTAMRMYRDPATGQLGSPPAGAFTGATDSQPQTRATALEDAGAEAVDLPGGGVKINLRGRYRSSVTRHLGPSGPLGHACATAAAPANE